MHVMWCLHSNIYPFKHKHSYIENKLQLVKFALNFPNTSVPVKPLFSSIKNSITWSELTEHVDIFKFCEHKQENVKFIFDEDYIHWKKLRPSFIRHSAEEYKGQSIWERYDQYPIYPIKSIWKCIMNNYSVCDNINVQISHTCLFLGLLYFNMYGLFWGRKFSF